MEEVRLLNYDEVYGNKRSKIFDKYGTKCGVTAFAAMTGVWISNIEILPNSETEIHTCYWRLKSQISEVSIYCGSSAGNIDTVNLSDKYNGFRLVFKYSQIKDKITREKSSNGWFKKDKKVLKRVKCFEYPQWPVPEEQMKWILKAIEESKVKYTGKVYTNPYNSKQFREFEYAGKKYI